LIIISILFSIFFTKLYDFLNLNDEILKVPSARDPVRMIKSLQFLKKKALYCTLESIRRDWRYVKGNENHLHFIGKFDLGNTDSHVDYNSDCDQNSSDSEE